jgi:hypothetical protein
MKPHHLLSLLLLLTTALPHAENFTYNGIKYTALTDSTCETKTGSYDGDAYYCNSVSGDLVIPETVYDENNNKYTVTAIGGASFAFNNITSITLPRTIKKVANYAFYACENLNWVACLAETPPSIGGYYAFDYAPDAPLIVMNKTYENTVYWKDFKSISYPVEYEALGETFEVDGLKYEVISNEDLTCRLYAINESAISDQVEIPESVNYNSHDYTPIEITGVLINGETTVKQLSIPSCVTNISDGIIFNTHLEKFTINAPTTSNPIYLSTVDEMVLSSSMSEFRADLRSNKIGGSRKLPCETTQI